jgi:hypothetical protein
MPHAVRERVCGRCTAISKRRKSRCKLRTCRSLPYCHVHLPSESGVMVRKSLIEGAGLGLFATKRYKRNDTIPYGGTAMTYAKALKRYKWNGVAGKEPNLDYAITSYTTSERKRVMGPHGKMVTRSVSVPACVIDSLHTDEGIGVYANTCDTFPGRKRTCHNNAQLTVQKIDKPSCKAVARLRACTTIEPGEEIYTSYGGDYYIDDEHGVPRKLVPQRTKCKSLSGPSGVSKKAKAAAKKAKKAAPLIVAKAKLPAALAVGPAPAHAKAKAKAKALKKKAVGHHKYVPPPIAVAPVVVPAAVLPAPPPAPAAAAKARAADVVIAPAPAPLAKAVAAKLPLRFGAPIGVVFYEF